MRENAALLQRGASKPTDGPTTTPLGSEGSRPELRLVVEPEAVAGEPERGPRAEPEAGPAAVASGGFAEFFAAEYPRLLRVMYLVTGNRHEAEEITQDAFVRALERWDRVRAADNRPGYLYRIAVNLFRSKLRRVARAARKTLRPQAEADPFQAADERDAIARALVALPEGQREAVVMVEWLGMTDDEVGQILGISPITVRVRIHRARGTMRPILRPSGEDEGSAEEPEGDR